jgi:hypothetical protein
LYWLLGVKWRHTIRRQSWLIFIELKASGDRLQHFLQDKNAV